jgi:hypothetical protein
MHVLLVNNGCLGSSEFPMMEARFPIGLGYLSAMLKQNGHTTELVWENPYRGEFTRHGKVPFPIYPACESIDFNFESGVWSGLSDRLVQPDVSTQPSE